VLAAQLRHTAITVGLDKSNGDVRSVWMFSRHRDLGTVALYDDAREDRGGTVARLVAAAVRHELAVMTNNSGLVVTLPNGQEFQLTIVRSGWGRGGAR
jgi:hypothetical protein